MENIDLIPTRLTEPGVEIGAFKTPLPGIRPIYVDRFAEYANEPTLADYYGDACSLPFYDSSLRYVASSHVLEHVANPLAALREWHRVLQHNGIIYMVIPDRRRTFDHLRPLTEPGHLLMDYRNRTNQVDGTHIYEFVYGIDWQMFSPATPSDEVPAAQSRLIVGYRQALSQGQEINIHFHAFEKESAVAAIELGNQAQVWNGSIEIMEAHEAFPTSIPNGFLIIARVKKRWVDHIRSRFSQSGLKRDARAFSRTNKAGGN